MQGVRSHAIAEDSCFIKHQPLQDGNGSPEPETAPAAPWDVEKAPVNVEIDKRVDEKEKDRDAVGEMESKTAPRIEYKQLGMTSLDCKDDFPEGGLKAWSVVVGGFCGSFSVFALINSTGVLLEYLQANQLKDYTTSQISWIFGLELFLTFFCGAPVGPIFDAYGPRVMVFIGSIFLSASLLLLGLCTSKLCRNHLRIQD
jgi:hypothetical protein